MIDTRNTIIRELQRHMDLPIIPNTDTQNRPEYPFMDYGIIAVAADSGLGNHVYGSSEIDVLNTLQIQNRVSVSFNAYSRDDKQAYNTAKEAYNWFKHIGVTILSDKAIAVVDVYEVDNRTMLEIDKYEARYGFDVMFRYDDNIDRTDAEMKEYSIIKE